MKSSIPKIDYEIISNQENISFNDELKKFKYAISHYGFLLLKNPPIDKKIKKGSAEYKKHIQEQREKLSIQRFKGLGEMNPEELWETTLNPDNRTMLRVQYSNGTKDKSREDQKMIKVLMGDEVAPRKDFITNNALNVVNLDI